MVTIFLRFLCWIILLVSTLAFFMFFFLLSILHLSRVFAVLYFVLFFKGWVGEKVGWVEGSTVESNRPDLGRDLRWTRILAVLLFRNPCVIPDNTVVKALQRSANILIR